MKISLVRAAYLNPFDLQNFYALSMKHQITAYSSLNPINDKIKLDLVKLFSPTDLPLPRKYKYQVLNRLFSDAHLLYGLEDHIKGSDIVHVNEKYYGYTAQACKEKVSGRVKAIVSTCAETIPFNNESLKGRKNNKLFTRDIIDRYIALTQKAKNVLLNEGTDSSKIDIIPMGIDLDKFKPDFSLRSKETINILSVVRLVEEKGILDLIKLHEFLKKDQRVHLTVVGTGPLKPLLLKNDIKVIDSNYESIDKIYQQSDIFLLLSKRTKTWEEQQGMVLVEAMATGLPVIAYDSGAITETLDKAGILVKEGDVMSVYQHINHLLSEPNMRLKLSNLSITRAKKEYDSTKIAARIEQVYMKALYEFKKNSN